MERDEGLLMLKTGELKGLAAEVFIKDRLTADERIRLFTDIAVSKSEALYNDDYPNSYLLLRFLETLIKKDDEMKDVAENDSALQQVVFEPVSCIDEQITVLKGLMAKIKVIDGKMQLYDFIGCIKRADFKAMYAAAKENKNIKRLFFTIECAKVWFHDGWEEQAAASIETTTKNMRSYRLEEINNGDYTDWYEKMRKLFGKSNKKK